jgi:uncharacterized membrane protein YeaQ/YmgE (transglycosylase-associated protein family)
MSTIDFVIIGVVCGFLAGFVTRGRSFGIPGDLIVGVIGALLGSRALDFIGLLWWGDIGNLFASVTGSVAFLALLRFFKEP